MLNDKVEGDILPLDIDSVIANFGDVKISNLTIQPPFLYKQGNRWRIGAPDMHSPVNREMRRERVKTRLLSNLPSIKDEPIKSKRLAVCCYGPSLVDHIDELKGFNGDIVTVSGAHDLLLAHGIVPNYHVEMDPREHKAEFVKSPHKSITYFISSGCHDRMFENLLGYDVVLWNLQSDADDHEYNVSFRPDDLTIHVGSAVGLAAIVIGRVLGYVDQDVYGMDCSSRESRHAGPHNGKVQKMIEVDCNGRLFSTSAQMIAAARDFFAMVPHIGAKLELKGDGLLQHWMYSIIERKQNA